MLGAASSLIGLDSAETEAAIDEMFARHASALVAHDGITFTAHGHDVYVRVGAHAEHNCEYDLLVQEHRLGKLVFSRSRSFSHQEIARLEGVLANLVHPLRNALMYREAVEAAARDPLTGLCNRGSLKKILEREIDLSRRHGAPFSLVMVDADNFKEVNDVHGHPVGDAVLKALGGCLTDCARDSDMIFRYGGEEFCLLLSNTALDGATRLADRMRRAVENRSIEVDEARVAITISSGVAELGPEDDGETLLARADRALYQAKKGGRNRVATERQI